jgi:hypothetical protein
MPSNTPIPIEETNLSLAWGKAFIAAMESSQTNPAPMVVSVTAFDDGLPPEDARIQVKLDELLAAHRKNTCSVSAMIIFPYQQWIRRGRPGCAEFSQWCIERFIPRLKARDQRNKKGLYFERMMNFQGGIAEGTPGKNQLLHLITWWNQQLEDEQKRPARSRMQVACFDPFLDHNRECRPYFPCLQQIGFSYDSNDGLTVNAFYPTQYLFDRAYGNYLGLCHLGAFMAHQMGISLVRFNCFIGRAGLGGATKTALQPLKELVEQVIKEAEGENEA